MSERFRGRRSDGDRGQSRVPDRRGADGDAGGRGSLVPARPGEGAGRDRAQTVQDFAVGVSVFLLTLGFVFAFVPTLFAPFATSVDPGSAQQAQRVSETVVSELSVNGQSNRLDQTKTSNFFLNLDLEKIQNEYGLPDTAQVNIALKPTNPTAAKKNGKIFSGGQTYRDQPAATSSRVVVVSGIPQCDPSVDAYTGGETNGTCTGGGSACWERKNRGSSCLLVVRVW